MSSPDFFDDLESHLDRAAHRQARYGRLAAAPVPSVNAVLAAVVVALLIGAGALAIPRLTASDPEVTSPPPTTRGPEAIIVTPDTIRLGEDLMGVGIAKENGRLYVLASRARDADRQTPFGILAAFEDTGRELWRTELDRIPGGVRLVDGDPWVFLEPPRSDAPGPVSQVRASDGSILGEIEISDVDEVLGAFGSLWITTRAFTENGYRAERMARMDPDDDPTPTPLDVPRFRGGCSFDPEPADAAGGCPAAAVAGADAIWVPLADDGVARIDADTNDVTVIGGDEIGHEVLRVALDGDVVYVASADQVSSIVDGQVVATVALGEIGYLGSVDGAFGAVDVSTRRLQVLKPNEPMLVESRPVLGSDPDGFFELDGEAWEGFGSNYGFRRVKLQP